MVASDRFVGAALLSHFDSHIILHGDMDAFYASVEQRDQPCLQGYPVLIGHPGQRSVVATASYEARRFGIKSAMPMQKARMLCPDAVVVPPRLRHYAKVSEELMRVFRLFSPDVEPLSLDEAFVDMSQSLRLWSDPMAIGRALQDRVYKEIGLTISVGIATTKYVAKVASSLH